MPLRSTAHALALCLLAAPMAAQSMPEAVQAASPGANSAPPPRVELPAPAASPLATADLDAARRQWLQRNNDVAAFPRGHADLLRWEARRAGSTDALAPPAPRPLTWPEALQRSLKKRPDLVLVPSANALESATRQQALARHSQALRSAWLAAVAAREALDHERQELQAADSAAELGLRMVQAGNWSQARLLREQLAQARQQARVLQAQGQAQSTLEGLLRLMGLWQPEDIVAVDERLPRTLPDLPAPPQPPTALEAVVLRAEPTLATDLADTRRSARGLTDQSRLRWDRALDAAVGDLPAEHLPNQPLRLADPLLQREHGLQDALEAEARLLQHAVSLRSQARETWGELTRRYALAEHASNVLLPLQTALEQETLLRYNGMLQSTWDLIEAARARVRAAADASRARHAFWQAQLNWDALQVGVPPLPAAENAGTPTAPAGSNAAH